VATQDMSESRQELLGMVYAVKNQLARLRKSNKVLLGALEAVEWVELPDYADIVCPWCYGLRKNGHTPDCQRQAAVIKAKGEK